MLSDKLIQTDRDWATAIELAAYNPKADPRMSEVFVVAFWTRFLRNFFNLHK